MIPVDPHAFPDWLLRLLHVDPDRIPEGADTWIDFKRLPESGWALVALLALLAGVAVFVWIYRREGGLTGKRRGFLAALRAAAFLLAALALSHPVLELSVERDQEAVTIVLLDNSLSLATKDAYPMDAELREAVSGVAGVTAEKIGELSRAEVVARLLDSSRQQFLRDLADRNRLRVYTFSDALEEVGTRFTPPESVDDSAGGSHRSEDSTESPEAISDVPVISAEDLRPRGTVTDIAAALREAVEKQGNAPVAAIVLVSDGRWTEGEDPGTGVASFLAQREIPVHVIGVGDPSPTRNLRVMAVLAPERIFSGDPVAVDVRVSQRGFGGETIQVDLHGEQLDLSTNGARLETTEITFDEATEATARFRVRLRQVGRHRLAARISVREGESFETDNERSVVVEVVDQAPRVLLIAGAPSNEFRMLRDMFRRDQRVHLASWLMSADPELPQEGNSVLAKLPSSPEELFEYDVTILQDIDPRGLPAGFLDLVERFVGKHRGGLAYIAGEKFTARVFGKARLATLTDLLPVEPDRIRADNEFARGRYYLKEWPLVPTQEALFHPSTRLSSNPDRNREIWAELPGVYWSFPVARVKPGATVLLQHSNPAFMVSARPRPLLAYQFYEGGRTLFLGVDESWRWRGVRGGQEVCQRFWMQILRTLTEGRLRGDSRNMVMSDRDVYNLGDVIRLSAFVQDESYEPSTAEAVELLVVPEAENATEKTVHLQRDPQQKGWFRGVYNPEGIGTFEITLEEASKVVRVEVPDLEFQDPRLDESTLQDLATVTKGSNGPITEYQSIPERIPDRRRRLVITDEPRPLWDNSVLLGMIVLLLTIEWSVRKWSRLS